MDINDYICINKKYMAGWRSWYLVGLITQRPQVQVLSPQQILGLITPPLETTEPSSSTVLEFTPPVTRCHRLRTREAYHKNCSLVLVFLGMGKWEDL